MNLRLSAIIFTLSIFIFFLAGLVAFLDHQGFSLKLFVFSFWLTLLGTIIYFWEIKNEK